MILFYRGPHAVVTNEVFEVLRPRHQSFPIRELSHVEVVTATPGHTVASSGAVRFFSTGLAVTAAVVAFAGWPLFGQVSMSVVAFVVMATSAAVAVASWRARVRLQALWAVHRGNRVCLFQTTDNLMFGQVSRALKRVLERIEDRR